MRNLSKYLHNIIWHVSVLLVHVFTQVTFHQCLESFSVQLLGEVVNRLKVCLYMEGQRLKNTLLHENHRRIWKSHEYKDFKKYNRCITINGSIRNTNYISDSKCNIMCKWNNYIKENGTGVWGTVPITTYVTSLTMHVMAMFLYWRETTCFISTQNSPSSLYFMNSSVLC